MKKFLPFVLCLFVVAFSIKTRAQGNQCGIERAGFQVTSVTPGSGDAGCTATTDVYFVANVGSSGQQFFTAHIWDRSTYPGLTYGGVPTQEQLQSSQVLRTLVVQNTGTAENPNWQLSTIYGGDNSSPVVDNSGVTLTAFTVPPPPLAPQKVYEQFQGFVFFRLSGISVTTDAACQDLSMAVDVWGSSSATNNAVGCATSDVSLFECTPESTPIMVGTLICEGAPRAFSVSANNFSGCFPYFINYDVRVDANNNGELDDSDPSLVGDADGDGFADGSSVVFPGEDSVTAPKNYATSPQSALFVTATAYTFSSSGTAINTIPLEAQTITNECAILPVKFSSFTVQRNKQNRQQVDLTWSTAQEQNNRGFHIQRKTTGEWQNIGFVSSAAENGNSNATINYSFKDLNNFRGVSNYRLLQVDLDARSSFSDVRSVRGADQAASVVIYPNPAKGGRINLLFAEEGVARDVVVSDLSGRTVKQYREITNSLLAIEGLTSGFYTIKITDRKTAATLVEKVVVQ